MFSRRVFGGNPDSFKLILEYGKESHVEGVTTVPTLPGGQVRLPVALATLEFEFNGDETEAAVLERFTQKKSNIAFERMEQRVVLKLTASEYPLQHVKAKLSVACISPALRCMQAVRITSTGAVPEALLTALLKHCDLSGVWKLRGAEGFGNFWASCCEVRSWSSLANLNLSACGLTQLPASVGALGPLRILRLSHNRLAALPPELSALSELEVLAADHNQLTALPAELRRCSSLRHLELEGNRLVAPVLDLRALSQLASLQLYGNPLEYLPELSPASALRSLSLANVRIMADAAFTRWEVEVAPLPYISRGHKLSPLFKLTLRRSSCQHPLLAGALGRIAEDRSSCELLAREETAIQQLVLMALSEQPVVAEQACRTLGGLAALGASTARRLLAHDVGSTITSLLRAARRDSKLCGLHLLGSLAAGSDAVSAEILTPELLQLLHACVAADDPDPRVAALTALAALAFCPANKAKIRGAPGLLPCLVHLASTPSQQAPSAAEAAAAAAVAAASAPPVRSVAGSVASGWSARALSAGSGAGTSAAVAGSAGASGPGRPEQQQAVASASQPQARSQAVVGTVRPGTGSPPRPGGAAPMTMPMRSGGLGDRLSDSGGAGAAAFAAMVGSPPSAAPSFTRQTTMGGATSPPVPAEPTSPQPQELRPLHHSASTPAAMQLQAGGVPRSASPVRPGGGSMPGAAMMPSGVMSPISPLADGSSTNQLPTAIALAPPRAVTEPVAMRDQARLLAIKVLAILGENEQVRCALGQPPLSRRGVRILALDGGGMRGLALVAMLRQLQRRAGRPLQELFDLVVGTSTGAIVAVGLGVFHFGLDQCEAIYTGLGHKVFNQAGPAAAPVLPREEVLAAQAAASPAAAGGGWRDSLFRVVRGTSTNLRVAVYGCKHDPSTFEALLKQMCDMQKLGCVGNQLIDAAALGGPKVAAVATLVSVCPVTPYLFTTYELPPEVAPAAAALRACPASSRHQMWQAVRASSAAPWYLEDFVAGEERWQDGAATANNPAVFALQQARLLWPDAPIAALVSLGCGAAPPVRRERGAMHAMLDTGAVLVDAATNTDRADEALSVLMPLVPGAKYYRFQPVDERCGMELDDVDQQHWAALQAAADEYCSAHAARFEECAALLAELAPGAERGEAGEGEGGEEAEAEGDQQPDDSHLPPLERLRLGERRGVLLLQAPMDPEAGSTAGRAAAGAGPRALPCRPIEDASCAALAALPAVVRRVDLAATAADAALSSALAAEHLRRLDEAERRREEAETQRQEEGRQRAAEDAEERAAQAEGEAAAAAQVATAAAEGLEAAMARQGASVVVLDGMVSAAEAAVASSAEAGASSVSPRALLSPRSGSFRPWASAGGRAPHALVDGAAPSGVQDVGVVAAAAPTVADAAEEAAAGASTTTAPSSSLYEYFFGSTPKVARGPSGQEGPTSEALGGSGAAPASSPGQVPLPALPLPPADGATTAAGLSRSAPHAFALPVRSPSSSTGGVPPTPSAAGPAGQRPAPTNPQTATHPTAQTTIHTHRPRTPSADTGIRTDASHGGRVGHAPSRPPLPVLLAGAVLADLADRVGLLHLALAVEGGDAAAPAADGEAAGGLVVDWRSEVVAVVEPGPDAERLLRDLGHRPGAASLSALFAAARGAPLAPPPGCGRCREYRLLARQEVWAPGGAAGGQGGRPVASLLLQVTRPAALLHASDLPALAPQLAGLVVSAAAPLPAALSEGLLRAGARAVLAPRWHLPCGVAAEAGAAAEAAALGQAAVEEAAELLAAVVSGLAAGESVAAALAAAEREHGALTGWLACHLP